MQTADNLAVLLFRLAVVSTALALLAACIQPQGGTDTAPDERPFRVLESLQNNGTTTLHLWLNISAAGARPIDADWILPSGSLANHSQELERTQEHHVDVTWYTPGEAVAAAGHPAFEDSFHSHTSLGINGTLCVPNETFWLNATAWYSHHENPVLAPIQPHGLNADMDYRGCGSAGGG